MYVLHEMKKMSLWYFIVRICAVIGGVFTVSGILNGILSEIHQLIYKDSHPAQKYSKVVEMTHY